MATLAAQTDGKTAHHLGILLCGFMVLLQIYWFVAGLQDPLSRCSLPLEREKDHLRRCRSNCPCRSAWTLGYGSSRCSIWVSLPLPSFFPFFRIGALSLAMYWFGRYTPFCDSRKETDGFRFWKSGYWKEHLQGKPYHIRYDSTRLLLFPLISFLALCTLWI